MWILLILLAVYLVVMTAFIWDVRDSNGSKMGPLSVLFPVCLIILVGFLYFIVTERSRGYAAGEAWFSEKNQREVNGVYRQVVNLSQANVQYFVLEDPKGRLRLFKARAEDEVISGTRWLKVGSKNNKEAFIPLPAAEEPQVVISK
jgi:hypothetical protein